jgi:phenylpropionate dioxygenase-like ring-hydroxylating dioxygenase large terminal subunit
MDHASAIALTKRLINNVKNNTTDMAPDTMMESANVFINEERWRLERKKLFLDTPQVVGFAGEIKQTNSFLTTEVIGIPIVVTRDQQGKLHAFINACAHRGSRVANGKGIAKRMNCIFHGWSYDLDGKLAGRPEEAAFDQAGPETNLQALPVSDKSGLIVVGLHRGISQEVVDTHLDDIADAIKGLHFDRVHSLETRRFEVAADWKLVTGLSHEGYHFATLHRDSLAPLMTANATVDFFGKHSRWAFPLKGIETLAKIDESDWPIRPPAAMNHTIYPGTVIIVPSSNAQMIRVEPGKKPGTSVVYYIGVHDNPKTRDEDAASYDFGGKVFEQEDLPVAEQCQQGLSAGQSTVIFGRNEPIVQFWHRRWNAALINQGR